MAKNLNNLNISIFSILKASEKSNIPVLMLSNPGVGKTSTVYMFAKVRGYEVVLLRGNSTSAEEITGYDVSPKDVTWGKPQAACHLRPSWFEHVLRNKEEGKKTLLFLDELTTANEFVQAALLHLIFERKCGEERLPEDTLIVSCGNYINNLAAGGSFNLLPPVMNRFMLFNITPNVDDLDIFLNKYEGALVDKDGAPTNYMKELEEVLREIDSQEMTISNSEKNKIGEHIERCIRSTTKMLITNNHSLDLTVTDLQDIYVTTDGDPKVYGFVTFRTLNYLRDVAVAYYTCFGKAGMSSDNFRNAIEGLCGLGLIAKPQGNRCEIVKNYIGKEYFDALNIAINDIEKMKSGQFKDFEDFFIEISKIDSKKLGIPEFNAIINKIAELENVKEIAEIERPIDSKLLVDVCNNVSNSAGSLLQSKVKSNGMTSTYTTEQLTGIINSWNYTASCISAIARLVIYSSKGYDQDTVNAIRKKVDDLRVTGNKVRATRMFFVKEKNDEAEIKLIPEVKDIKFSNEAEK